MTLKKFKKAQHMTEYAILVGVVISAFVGMQVYVKRGLNARVKAGTDAFTHPNATISFGNVSTEFKNLSQYEPYYEVSKGESYQESIKQTHMGDGKIVEEIESQISARAGGSYRGEEAGNATQETRDAVWGD